MVALYFVFDAVDWGRLWAGCSLEIADLFTELQSAMIHKMGAIGFPDTTPEVQLQSTEFAESDEALKALSTTSHSFRGITQTVPFEKL